MKRPLLLAGALALGLLMYQAEFAEWFRAKPDHVAEKLKQIQRADPELRRDCGERSSMRAFLVLGQSNAANHGSPPGSSERGLLWSEGACHALTDPVAGGTGTGGSIWPRFADAWFARTGERSLFIVLAIDATSVNEWATNPGLLHRLDDLLQQLRRYELHPDAVLWQQGEADARRSTAAPDYAQGLEAVIARLRAGGVSSPVFLARSTRCRSERSDPVRQAVNSLIDARRAILAGPDTDEIGLAARHDGCHFGTQGLAQAATAWVDVVVDAGVLAPLAQPGGERSRD